MGRTFFHFLVCLLVLGISSYPLLAAGPATGLPLPEENPPAPPVLLTPALGSAEVPTSPLFRWTRGEGATSYTLQVSTSLLFSDLTIDQAGLSDTSFTPPILLADGTTYYWRVRAAGPGGFSRWEPMVAGWPFATVTEGVHPPELLSPASGATDVSVTPTFAWNGAAGNSSYELQLSLSPLFTDPILDLKDLNVTNFTVPEPLPDETVFYWRVRSFADGIPSVWIPVVAGRPFKTGQALPPPPALVSPAKDAIDVPTQPRFVWTIVTGVVGYQLQVSSTLLFDTLLVNEASLSETTYVAVNVLANATTYYWRVRSFGPSGPGLWSPRLTGRPFMTKYGSLAAPILISPLDGAVDVPTRPIFRWNAVDGATSYELEVTSSQFLGGTEYNGGGITGTTFQPPVGALNNGILYTWRVRAVNESGNSAWSGGTQGRSFTTKVERPSQPLLYLPPNGAMALPQAIVLTWWNKTDSTSASFRVQVATDSSFATSIVDKGNIVETATLVTLATQTKYYWRVLGINASGTSEWSDIWTFSTGDASLALPTLISPVADASDVRLTPTFTWLPVAGATSYDVQVSVSPMFIELNLAVDARGLAATATKPSVPLHKATKYYWRVRAMSNTDTTLWSPTITSRAFTTVSPAPPAPTLVAPSFAETEVSLTPLVCWSPAPGATTYSIELATDPEFANVVASYCGIEGPCFTLPASLSGNSTFFWHVRASNAGGSSTFSPTWKFTTATTVPTPPTIVMQPSSETVLVGQSTTFHVSAIGTGPLSYQWLKNSATLSGATEPVYTTPALGPADAGSMYRCMVTNSLAQVLSDPAIVTLTGTNPSLLKNGNFESGSSPWMLFSDGVATFSDNAPGAGSAHAARVEVSGEGANVQLYQAGLRIEPNTLYKLTFKAYAHKPTLISVTLLKHICPFTSYGLDEDLYLESSWKSFTVVFSTPSFTVPVTNARLMFWLGSFDAQGDLYYFDDVVLEKSKMKTAQASVLANPGFESDTEPWRFYSDGEATFGNDMPGNGSLHAGHVSITSPGTNMQLYQADLTLNPNSLYRLSFSAYSNTSHDLSVWLHQHVPPYQEYGLTGKKVDLAASWSEYSLLFTTPGFGKTVKDARLRFWLTPYATAGDEYYIDDVVLEDIEASPSKGNAFGGAVASKTSDQCPTEFSLNANYPNPFNPSTSISYGLPEAAQVTLKIYSLLGQEIATVMNGSQPAGYHTVMWNMRNSVGGDLGSGIYIYRLFATGMSGKNFTANRKMLLLK